MTAENDIVLIYFEDKPLVFARIEEIKPDIKKNWRHVRLLLLQLPVQSVTWILKDAYIDGQEYTMNGKRMRLEKVVAPKDDGFVPEDKPKNKDNRQARPSGDKKVIPLSDRKPKT